MAFRAEYAGPCESDCTAGIQSDDLIEQAGTDAGHRRLFRHVECPPEPRPAEVCPSCWLAMPASGVCDTCS